MGHERFAAGLGVVPVETACGVTGIRSGLCFCAMIEGRAIELEMCGSEIAANE